MRRLHVRGHENVLKRLLIQVSAFNLGMLMRQSLGVGTPRGLQGRICALMLLIFSLSKRFQGLFRPIPATRVGLNVAIAAATGAYRLSSENVLLPRAARPPDFANIKVNPPQSDLPLSFRRSPLPKKKRFIIGFPISKSSSFDNSN